MTTRNRISLSNDKNPASKFGMKIIAQIIGGNEFQAPNYAC